jgi:spore germination protein YaaH
MQTYNLDGVNIDFEGLTTADRGSLINTFMTDLTNFIHTNLPGREVSYAGPIINWGGWDLPGLAKACDYVFIMGYDFYGSWSETSGPSAPLTGGTYNVTSGLTSSSFGYGGALASYANKLILGVPYFGGTWSTTTNAAYSPKVKYIGSTTYKTAMPNSAAYGILWDAKSQTPWFVYKSDTVYMQTWFETDSSLGLKYDLAKSKNLKGVGMWALGQDGTRTEYWNLLRKKYLVDVKTENNFIPSGFSLGQNYPNPFNPSTVIKYDIPYNCNVSLKVYDLLGREAATLVNEVKQAGSYSVQFNSKLASGVYYYTIKAGSFTQSKKMTILK